MNNQQKPNIENQKIQFKVIETSIKPTKPKKKVRKNSKNNENSMKRHAWEAFEDNALKIILSKTSQMTNIGWNKVAEMIKSYFDSNKIQYKTIRTGKQCRERWLYHLKKTGKTQWTKEEDEKLYELVKLKGRKWSEISVEMRKTDKEIKNHYYLSYRKRLRLIMKDLRSKEEQFDDEVNRIIESEAELYSIIRSKFEFWDLNEENVRNSICKYQLEGGIKGGSKKTLKNQLKHCDDSLFSTLKTNLIMKNDEKEKDFICNRQISICFQSKTSNVSFLSSKRQSFSNDELNIDNVRMSSFDNDRIFKSTIDKDGRDKHKEKKNHICQGRRSVYNGTDSNTNTNTNTNTDANANAYKAIDDIDEKDEKDEKDDNLNTMINSQTKAKTSILITKQKEDENFFLSPVPSAFNSSYSNFIVNLNEDPEKEGGFTRKYSQFNQFDYNNQVNLSNNNEKFEFFTGSVNYFPTL